MSLTFLAAEFTFTVEIASREKQRRDPYSMNSKITLYELHQKMAISLNFHPDSLHPQYRFSSDPKDTIPCDLTTHVQLSMLLTLLRERCVPPILASGKQSTRKLKPFTLQLFNKGDSPYGPSEAKVGIAHVAFHQTSHSLLRVRQANLKGLRQNRPRRPMIYSMNSGLPLAWPSQYSGLAKTIPIMPTPASLYCASRTRSPASAIQLPRIT
jgi:hypothetical protein